MKIENPGAWFEIYVTDIERAKIFYETVFDTTLTEMPMPPSVDPAMRMLAFPMTMDKTSGAPGALVYMKDIKAGGSSSIIYLASADCAIEEARVVAAGGTVTQSKLDLGESGFSVMGIDTEGNWFGIHSMN